MNPTNPPTQPPSAAELLAEPIALAAIHQAWLDSQAGDPANRHEEGGWIYMDVTTGTIAVQRAPRGTRRMLDLSNPPLVTGSVIVGTFHTHPNPTSEGWIPGPSPTDQRSAGISGVPWLIMADDGNYSTGPDRRRGGLAGSQGFPS
jgi:hypothetical protein